MSTVADKNLDDAANASDCELIRDPAETSDKKTDINDVCEETKKIARSVRFPDDDQLVTQYFEPANPWQDVPTITRAQLAAEYLEACRKHNTSCIECVLQQIRDLPEACMGGVTRAARLVLSEASLAGAAPVDALEAVLRRVQFRRLELDHSLLDDEGAEALFDMVEYYESASVLCISGPRNYGIRGWQAVSRMIKKSAELSELELSESGLEPGHAAVLSRALKLHSCRLRALTLQRAALAGEPLLCLVIALKSNSSVRELRLGDNGLSASDASQIASLLRYNTHIQLLDLSNNQIQDAGVAHLADALVEQAAHTPPSAGASPLSPHHCLLSGYEARGLAFLILWNNQLSRNCCVHLSKALRQSKSLCVLNVGHNPLGADAVRMVRPSADCGPGPSLASLGLQAVRLGPDAGPALADLVRADTDLQRLDLRDNRLGLAGLQALASAMQHNTNLTQIDLDEPAPESSLSAEESESSLCRRLTAEIRALCRRNEPAPRRSDHEHPLHRKISLTCHTACLLRGLALEEERRPRLRSPLPSPAPSPAGSPVPKQHSHSRFSVTRVTPERESSSDSCPSTPTRPTFCPTPSRFKVVQVMEPPQIQVHPATSQPRKSPSRFSVTRNYDSVYNPTPTHSPPPPSLDLSQSRVEVKAAAKVTTDVKTEDTVAANVKVAADVVRNDQEVVKVNETSSKRIEFDAKQAVSVEAEAAVKVDVSPVKIVAANKNTAKNCAEGDMRVIEDDAKLVAEATSVVAIDINKPSKTAVESSSNVSDNVVKTADDAKRISLASEAKAVIVSNDPIKVSTEVKAAVKADSIEPHEFDSKSIREFNKETVEASVDNLILKSSAAKFASTDAKDDRGVEKPSLHSVMTQTSLTETKREVRPTIIPDKRMEIKTVTAAAVKPVITDAKLERNIPIVAVTDVKDLEGSSENTQAKSENRIKLEDNSDVKTDSDNHVIEDSINLVKSDLKYSDVVKAVVDKTENISHDEKIECGVLKSETKLQKCCVEVSGDEKLDIGIEVTLRKETKVPSEKDNAMKQIVAITEDLGNIIQEMKDFTHNKCIIVPANIRDSVVLKKNKSESSLDSPDLEVSRLMNKKLIGSPFDSNSSLEISGSSMESLNERPTVQGPEELDRRKVNQVTFSTASSVESASDTTPVNTGNLLNLSVSSNESVSPIFGRFKKIHDSLSSLEASVSSLDSAKHEKAMVTSADSGIEHSLQHPAETKEDNSSNEGTLTNNSSLRDTMSRREGFQLLDNLTSSPKRTSSLLDMPALKNKSLDRMRKISWVAPSSSFHIPRQEDRDAKPSHLEKLLSIFQHPSSIFSRSADEPKPSHTPPRKDSSLGSSFWSWGSTAERDREEDSSEATDSTLSERVQVSFVDESFSRKLDSKTPSTDTDNTLSEFQPLPDGENDRVTKTTEENIVQSLELRENSSKAKVSVDVRPIDKVDVEKDARPRSFAAVLKSGSENSLDRQASPDGPGQPVDKLPSKVIRGIKENISPENTLTSSMSNTKALAHELEREVRVVLKSEPKADDAKDLAPLATIDVDDLPIAYIDEGKDKLDEARNETEAIDLGKDALSYLIYENKEFGPKNAEPTVESSLAQELKDAEIKEMLDLSPELVVDESLDVFPGLEVSLRTSPVVPERAKIKKANSLEDLKQLQGDKNSPKVKTIAFKVPESTTPRDIPERRTKLRTRSGSSPKSLPESLNKPCPLLKMDLMISKKKKKVSSLGKMARDSLLALNMSEEEIAEFRKSYKLTSVESLRSLESVSEDANSQSGNSVDSRCRSCLRTSQESLMSLDSITEDCKCGETDRPGKSAR